MKREFTAGTDDHDRRLETVLRKLCPDQSLGSLHKALRKGDIRLNGAKAAPETRVATGDTLAVWDVLLSAPAVTKAASAPLPKEWVLYAGDTLVVVNKPSGLLVHRGEGPLGPESDPPLDERLRAWLSTEAATSLAFRPGPLHRLDRETSGLIVFSRTLIGARTFSEALAERRVSKTYLAVLRGVLDRTQTAESRLSRDEGTRTSRVDVEGEVSHSEFLPLAVGRDLTLAQVNLGTGRTHQIRVHAQSLGFPLAGDQKYGGGPTPAGLDVPWLLHAWKLESALLPALVAPLPPARHAWIEKTFKISV